MRGKFIVIEGTDGSGKATQLKLLGEYFAKNRIPFKTDDYPRYDGCWGKLIGRYLMGEFGNPLEISPYYSVLPYMIDEYTGGKEIQKWIKGGNFVLSNRYFTSNVHQVAKFKGQKRKKFRDWLWDAGWRELGIYEPDLIIVLLVPPRMAMKMVKQKEIRGYTNGRRSDKVERDYEHQKSSYLEYLYMCKTDKNWVKINCCRRGQILSPREIHKKVLKLLVERKIL
jgi:dTMP kinase